MLQTDENLNSNLTKMLEIYENNSHEELISMLKAGNISQKQAAALCLNKICSADDAAALISNLTGVDGKIREAVSFKLTELLPEYITFFKSAEIYDVFLDAIVDINGNVCRNMLSVISHFKADVDFTQYFCPKLAHNALISAKNLSENPQPSGYKVNKEAFKLYWYLEAIYEFCDHITGLEEILTLTKSSPEYTIREKTAKILNKKADTALLLQIKQELATDPNYYVRR